MYKEDHDGFSEFKKSEKYFKKLKDFDKAEDLITLKESPEVLQQKNIQIHTITIENQQYEVYEFSWPKGFKVIKNYLSPQQVLNFAKKSLNDFIKEPNRTNMYIYKDDYEKKDQLPKNYDKDTFIVEDINQYFFNNKIRWANLGQHYDWDNRCYFQRGSPICEEMKQIALKTAEIFGQEKYNPQSVIVNYYGNNKSMGGHLDDGEPDQVNPIISFSLGLSCVFLIGSTTKKDKPNAIRLDSGDVVLMSKESRVCYHGVPRVIKGSFEWKKEIVDKLDKKLDGNSNNDFNCYNYLKEHRINFNFRQVEIDQEQINQSQNEFFYDFFL